MAIVGSGVATIVGVTTVGAAVGAKVAIGAGATVASGVARIVGVTALGATAGAAVVGVAVGDDAGSRRGAGVSTAWTSTGPMNGSVTVIGRAGVPRAAATPATMASGTGAKARARPAARADPIRSGAVHRPSVSFPTTRRYPYSGLARVNARSTICRPLVADRPDRRTGAGGRAGRG